MGLVKIHLADGWMLQTPDSIVAQFQSLLNNNREIVEQLRNYHSYEDGSPNVQRFTVDEVTFDAVAQSGKIRFAYLLEFHFGCSDLSPSTVNIETSNFNIDAEDKILSVFIHDKIGRDTYEEF